MKRRGGCDCEPDGKEVVYDCLHRRSVWVLMIGAACFAVSACFPPTPATAIYVRNSCAQEIEVSIALARGGRPDGGPTVIEPRETKNAGAYTGDIRVVYLLVRAAGRSVTEEFGLTRNPRSNRKVVLALDSVMCGKLFDVHR